MTAFVRIRFYETSAQGEKVAHGYEDIYEDEGDVLQMEDAIEELKSEWWIKTPPGSVRSATVERATIDELGD